ncbi:coronin-7 [Neocloeon triangulifer]|uniref:coronin-7 n=1 Tax=Neocloeon triangulifer TaxID=2078957 RepID=UPI00286F05F6|nr:coronin-7 [Neocloeon triangulifer]XP_059474038.1 coronin-7 [Neocloeon triangulifer]XP_059474039.1 coronin-7 [Neocloeon triangulifer]XP_059474040.1 coronin-7 [Neocloeon triangulifer]
MAHWRFKASKFKNAAPTVPKPEACIRDICVGSYQSYGNSIAASAAFMAFNVDHNGSNLAVLPIDDCGRKSKTMPLLHAHSDTVTDMAFSPFHDGLLVTGSQDCLVKIWHIPEKGLEESLSQPECVFSHQQRRVETVSFHPTADFLLTTTSYATVALWDFNEEKELQTSAEGSDVVQSLSWRGDGMIFATTCKDKQLRVQDPRSNLVTHSANSHQSLKDSRVVWLGDPNWILTTGFDAARLREVIIRDIRKFGDPVKILQLDSSTGILVPLFDVDTNMLFLAGKGDTTIQYMEVSERDPFLIEGLRHSGEQTKGACLVPKRALQVMQAEVNRVLQLTSNSVIPITYQVPRKSYRNYHSDLFPDTASPLSPLLCSQWMAGENKSLSKISLDPEKRQEELMQVHRGNLAEMRASALQKQSNKIHVKETPTNGVSMPPKPMPRSRGCIVDTPNNNHANEHILVENTPQPAARVTKANNGLVNSNYKSMQPRLGPRPYAPPSFGKEIACTETNGKGATSPDPADKPICEVDNKDVEEAEELPQANSKQEDQTKNDEESVKVSEDASEKLSIAERRRLYETRSASVQEAPGSLSPTPLRRRNSLKTNHKQPETICEEPKVVAAKNKVVEQAARAPERTSTVFGRVSKFRHLKGTFMPKAFHIENIRNISQQLPKECDGFHANPIRAAVPLSGPGGKIAVFELDKTGKLPDGVIPALVNGSSVIDFAWDPFDYSRLLVACDNGTVRAWNISDGGLSESTNEPTLILPGIGEKISFIKFHPLARDVLAIGLFDLSVRIWNLKEQKEILQISGHTDQIFSLAWSSCGKFCATVCKDTKIRVFEPRKSVEPLREGVATEGLRGSRVLWALDSSLLVVAGFDKISQRQILVLDAINLSNVLATVGLDVSPAILIPFYDVDSSTLFLTGKGDSTVYVFEVTKEAPYLCALSHHRMDSLHQGLSFLPKNECNISAVEFAKALRLTNNSIKPISYTVPRIKTELFQDDLFPPTRVTWEPAMEAGEWFSGVNKLPQLVSLKPEGMLSLSDNQTNNTNNGGSKASHVSTKINSWEQESIAETRNKIQMAVSNRMELCKKLEQDDMEGVEAEEWDEE